MRTCTSCGGSGRYDSDGSPPCSACNGRGSVEDCDECDLAADEMARLRRELSEVRAKLEEAKRAAFVAWWEICATRNWGFDPSADHVQAILVRGRKEILPWISQLSRGKGQS